MHEFSIYWTKEAKNSFNQNLDYLSRKWDSLAIKKLLNRVDEVVLTISENPNLYPVYRKPDKVHKCVVNKHIILFYRVTSSERVDLITFWNTHKNPESLKV